MEYSQKIMKYINLFHEEITKKSDAAVKELQDIKEVLEKMHITNDRDQDDARRAYIQAVDQ